MKKIAVVAAVIKHEDKILCVQRAPSKYDRTYALLFIDSLW